MKYIVILALILIGLPTLMYILSPVQPIVWRPDPTYTLTGPLQQNAALDQVSYIGLDKLPEPEDIAFDANGMMYTGLNDGRIVKIDPANNDDVMLVANTLGRPLGLRIHPNGDIIVADAVRGLLSVTPQGNVSVLVSEYEGRTLKLVDHLDIASNGDIYFSDASRRYGLDNYLYDFIEATATGDVYRYSAATQEVELLVSDLFFSNGVALNSTEEFLLIAETGRSRILQYFLSGEHLGQTKVFIDSLPAMPDNIYFDNDGVFWVGLIAMRDRKVEGLAAFPKVRKLLGSLPSSLLLPKEGYGFVIGLNEQGQIVHNYQGKNGLHHITSAIPYKGKLYLGSLQNNAIGVVPLK
ncbi:MAG: SMP-30/gluconolactonase/LRE family protein [Glaciecola sp.]